MAVQLLEYFTHRSGAMVDLMRGLVELESPSYDKQAVDSVVHFLAPHLKACGAQVSVLPQSEHGDFLHAEWGEGDGQILVLCHLDTVWDRGTLAKRPFRVEEGRAYGPGVFDMKGGVALAVGALQALRDLNRRPRRKVVLLFTSDEEIGSPAGRPVIEELARQSNYTLVLEPAISSNGAVKTARKGVGFYTLTVRGRASHAGGAHSEGRSAIEELAHQVLRLHRLTDYRSGTTVNVGVIQGGSRSNVVAAEAVAQVDVRVPGQEEAARVESLIRGLRPVTPGVTIEVSGGLNRPPMERTPAIVQLYTKARSIAAELGFALPEGSTGGVSDGNFTAALGVPTLDGLGVTGNGAHAENEHVVLADCPQRAALLVRLLESL